MLPQWENQVKKSAKSGVKCMVAPKKNVGMVISESSLDVLNKTDATMGRRITRAGHKELKNRSLVDSDSEEEADKTAKDDCYDSAGSDSTEKRKAKSILRF